MRTLLAADLDRTLIYSRGAVTAHGDGGRPLVAVERYEGADASWIDAAAAARLAELARHATVVPATTRTPEQYRRVRLPGPPPRYAVTANGGILLVDDEPDQRWARHVSAQLATVASLEEIGAHAAKTCHPEFTAKLRTASGLFCYAVLHRDRLPDGFVAGTTAWAHERGWQVSLQGRKLYWVPTPLTKSAAVAAVAELARTAVTLAAGDSLLDADLLTAADAGIAARHGELVASGWENPRVSVTVASGVQAGAEIVDWFGRMVDATPDPGVAIATWMN